MSTNDGAGAERRDGHGGSASADAATSEDAASRCRWLLARALDAPAEPAERAFTLATAAAKRGDVSSARAWFERAQRLGAPCTTVALGLLERDFGRIVAAIDLLQAAAARAEPRAAVALSELLLRQGRCREARDALRATPGFEADPEARQAMSAILVGLGDLLGALREGQAAQALGWPVPTDAARRAPPPHPVVRLQELAP